METKKDSFFVRIKKAVFNFDEYHNFAMEKIRTAIAYYLILMIIFSVVITIVTTHKVYNRIENIKTEITKSLPDFKFENYELVMEQEEKIVFEDESSFLGIIIDSKNVEPEYIKDKYGIMFLKDKMIITYGVVENKSLSPEMSYKDLFNTYGLTEVTKENTIDYLNNDKMTIFYLNFFVGTLICKFLIYSLVILLDIIILSVLGLLVSRIFKINLKFEPVLNMAFYARTLSIVLYLVYIIVNILTGFEVKYFRMAYDRYSIYIHYYSNTNN